MCAPDTPRIRIGVAHQTILPGDAIGNDIAGACRLLDRLGFEVTLICEYLHPALASGSARVERMSPREVGDGSFDMILYHHSIEWPLGEALLERHRGPVVVKYHNISPAHFFEGYSARYRDVCERGRAQTRRLVQRVNVVRWQADSSFNAEELRELGITTEKVGVVPPFMTCNNLFNSSTRPAYGRGDPIELLFVGRRAPNKGHRHLLQTVAAFRLLYPLQPVRLTVIGAVDDELAGYCRELGDLERELGVSESVRWLSHVPDRDVLAAFEASHIYLSLSEHEGFCVPVVEAQALGIPVIASDTPAVRETAGEHQIVVPQPRGMDDYDRLAAAIHEIYWNEQLRNRVVEAGFGNVHRRFSAEHIENLFLDDVLPTLLSVAQ